MSTHNLCFEQKCEKYQKFLSENFQFLVVKFSIYLNRLVFVMENSDQTAKACSLIRVLAEHSVGSQGFKASSCGQRRLGSAKF